MANEIFSKSQLIPFGEYKAPDRGPVLSAPRAPIPSSSSSSSDPKVNVQEYIGSIAPSENMSFVKDEYGKISAEISKQIQMIADKPLEVDGAALQGQVMAGFETYKTRTLESATASVNKAALDLDAYFGSAKTGSVSSGQRAMMAARVKGSMMKETYQALGGVFEKYAADSINIGLEAAKTNISAAATKAGAISALYAQGIEAYKSASSLMEQDYLGRLEAAVNFAELDAKARGDALARDVANLNAATSLLGNKNFGITGALRYGLPTVENPMIATNPYNTKYTSSVGGTSVLSRL